MTGPRVEAVPTGRYFLPRPPGPPCDTTGSTGGPKRSPSGGTTLHRELRHPRVFGIGFHKTGTTSLALALGRLGYTPCHGAGPVRRALGSERMMQLLKAGSLEPIFHVAEGFDAFADNPWYLLFRELDARFPGSRFVFTTRDERSWLDSAVRHFGSTSSPFREWIYGVGSPVGNEGVFLERYRRHQRAVREHFADRAEDLLVLDLEAGQGWRELCTFLGRPVLGGRFPHANRRRPRARRLGSALRRLLRAPQSRGDAPQAAAPLDGPNAE